VDETLGVLSHEVRNLIATFVGFTELLMSQEWPRERQMEYLETMRAEGVRVEQFLQEASHHAQLPHRFARRVGRT
jgi:signal transduction histidine kinase